ncbi:PorP/SprF family type IX secretion system membrane protein [Mucilaginibacter pedocola]|uniref:Type IX secretion system membrane protein PorP/SprF n=1 Tax=Mucilaginibacter pedocola TaxID=1792845 RepID=A0A1S9PH95_9SPHI|nr:PorP/SprF family type IX secretion system membrane protein [Mucilaginibacter pedocola]OOQ60334.1 hypothetical protein BC343_25245 [Mucilaginibacter pedocola]
MKTRLFIFAILTVCVSLGAAAQDHIYSQFYNAPNYLNPALNGQFEGDLRLNMIYRNQWSSLPGPLNYYTFSADLNLPALNGGIGLMFSKSSEGTAYLNKMNLSGIYSYSVEFGNSTLSFGLQAGFTNRRIDADKLVFLDQLNSGGIIPGGVSGASPVEFNNKMFFDAGTGINLVKGNFMIGLAGQHLNKPNETLTGATSILPMRFNGYMSYKFEIDNGYDDNLPSVIPSVVLYRQAGITSFSAGMQYKHRNVNVGVWYRGDGKQQDALVISFIFDVFTGGSNDKVRFGASHDATTSKLPYTKTSGTTEGALSYETTFQDHRGDARNTMGNKRCYDFY